MKNIFFLDMVRGTAAVLVVMGHLRSFLFTPWTQGGLITYIFYALTSLGHQAVIVFFVLSGFFVGSSFINHPNFNKYLLKRLIRLYTVILPALLLTYILDLIGIRVLKAIPLYAGFGNNHVLNFDAIQRLNFETFLSNILFLQDILYASFGTNASLWSLAYEFWFYVLFPLSYSIIYCKKHIIRIINFTLFVSILFIIGIKGITYYLIWLMGVVIYVCYQKRYKVIEKLLNSKYTFAIVFILLFLAVLASLIYKNLQIDLILGLFFSIFILNLLYKNFEFKPFLNKIAYSLSQISFSLYAIHLPIIVLFYGYYDLKLTISIYNIAFYFLIILLLVILAKIFWLIFKKHHTVIYEKIYNLIWNSGQ